MSSVPHPFLGRVAQFTRRGGKRFVAICEQPAVVRITHWIAAITIPILIASGIQIFFAFPSFGSKVPQHNFLNVPVEFDWTEIGAYFHAVALGQWLAGAEWWHFTFMWFFAAAGVIYILYEIISKHYKTVLFKPRDLPGVWPMVRHYFLFGKKPASTEQYNALQKLAYTAAIFFGAVSLLSGMVLWNPVQFSWLTWLLGGFHFARILHFSAMIGFILFIPGHLIMVALHGWRNFTAMLTGWKENPEYAVSSEPPPASKD